MRIRGDRSRAVEQYETTVKIGLLNMQPERVLARFDYLKSKDPKLIKLELKHSKNTNRDRSKFFRDEEGQASTLTFNNRKNRVPVKSSANIVFGKNKENLTTRRMISQYLGKGKPAELSISFRKQSSAKSTASHLSTNRSQFKNNPQMIKSKSILIKDRSLRTNKTVTFEDQHDNLENIKTSLFRDDISLKR